ncbi:hypothetical protein [Ammoniphilus sp. CFH 90114]|uniref:hypothetical protein n=1 Tax=Ammoniphilus sp. CFH 90114 TaxID=2493665 RepID=UPI00100EC7F9|nr:hypothetical protein [Ammoniphilus sp. CFH 90114]RXT05300.1 hypothetical protein EIZ39_18180 [Ammoniphilus sp. CFH 90114]
MGRGWKRIANDTAPVLYPKLFFKWVKQHLKIKPLYGTDEKAVLNQVYLSLIYLLFNGNDPDGDTI